MLTNRFLDDTLDLVRCGELSAAMYILTGHLHSLRADEETWPTTVAALRRHRLHDVLLEDPYLSHSFHRPRGYPGDAGLIDLIYDMVPPPGTHDRARNLFDITTHFVAANAVRMRLDYARTLVSEAHRAGQRICVLACGHFREGDELSGLDMSNVTLVDQDPQSLAIVQGRHGPTGARTVEANVFSFLRRATQANEQYDLVYTLGLTDYLDERAMNLLHRLLHKLVADGGRAVIANFRPDLICTAWMEAVMDWHLIYRDEAELAKFATKAGFAASTWIDPTGHIAWASLKRAV